MVEYILMVLYFSSLWNITRYFSIWSNTSVEITQYLKSIISRNKSLNFINPFDKYAIMFCLRKLKPYNTKWICVRNLMRCLFALMSYVSILSLSIVVFVCFYVNNEERLALGRHHVKKFLECCLFPKYLPNVLVTNDVVIDEYHVSLFVVFKVSKFN